jgi:putative ABC transport system ATP-binding protein
MIKLSGISKVYRLGDIVLPVLGDIDLEVEKSELISIMGPSGSGKSTLMNIIGCLDKPTSGSYQLEGVEIATLSEDKLAEIRNRKIGFIFQGFNLIPHLNALENTELPLSLRGQSDHHRSALEALEMVGLSDRIHHKPAELSGGQQQRVAIARVLTQRPSIILADEPTGNLDSHSSQEIMSLLDRLNREEEITTIIVTHDPSVASHAERTIRMEDGMISSIDKR